MFTNKREEEKWGIPIQTHSKQIYISNFVPYGLWEIFLHTDKTIQKLQKVKEKLSFEEKPRTGSYSDQSMLVCVTDWNLFEGSTPEVWYYMTSFESNSW